MIKTNPKIRIAVVGGSHSALSASRLLLHVFPDSELSITILHRGGIRVYYDSESEAIGAGYTVAPGTVCAVSGQVNRYGGIRPPARDLYEQVVQGLETRLSFVHAGSTGTGSELFYSTLAQSDLIVPAFGYETALPQLVATHGEQISWALDDKNGQALMDNSTAQLSCMLSDDCVPLPNVFGLGLGFGLQSGGDLKIGEPRGVRIDGQAQYHSWLGAVCLNFRPEIFVLLRLILICMVAMS